MRTPDSVFPATAMLDTDWWQALWPDPHDVILALGIEARRDAADLRCGNGWCTEPPTVTARYVFAIDIDPQMLEQTKT